MHLTKHNGFGNDFLVALIDAVPAEASALASSWCHRTWGIGADGLIFGTPDATADLRMTLFNSDGSRAEISGNGIRCLAQAAFEQHADAEMTILTDAGPRRVEQVTSNGNQASIAVEMGPVNPGPAMVDLALLERPGFEVLRAETADVGNPHVVIEVDHLDAVDPAIDGPAIEALWKPEGINVHFLTQLGPAMIRLVHWERGAGVTQACGSGATVAATVAHRWGMVPERVHVAMPGGTAEVEVGASARLVGSAIHVANVEALDVPLGRPVDG